MNTAGPDLSSLLPGYTLERELGRGAMGIVYLARHESLGRLVAVKELQGTLAADPATRSRFVVEAKVMASLDHPHVVPVYDFVERDERCALVMEQLPGGTVWDRFVGDGISMPHATAITLATCSAMQHAHDAGVLHRDIKPENLMFDGSGSMKVTDFGIARVVNGASTKATAAGSVLGTPAYMAPEQAEGKEIAPSVDVYATATMFYEMLSGRLPFDRTDSLTGMLTQRILQDPTPLAVTAPHVPKGIADAAMRGLARDPKHRTPTAEAFGLDIAQAATDAWGIGWLDSSGVVVTGSDSIERAARSIDSTPAQNPGGVRSTVLPGTTRSVDPSHASETVLPSSPDVAAVEPDLAPTANPTVSAPQTPDSPAGEVEVEVEASTPPPVKKVKPKASDRDVGRARADQIDQLVDISEILKAPARPVAQYLIAAALFAVGLAWAVIGSGGGDTLITFAPDGPEIGLTLNGARLSPQPVEIDLAEPIVLTGAPQGQQVAITFEQFGAPIGSTDVDVVDAAGTATLDTGFVGRISSGALDATVEVSSPDLVEGGSNPAEPLATFSATGTNPWYLTAAGIITVVLMLFGVAGIESYLRAFRRGRGTVTSYAGLLVTGAIFGAASAIACTIVFGTARTVLGIVGPAAFTAAGALALGLATRANRTRRRAARQELRHTAIKALAKR